VLCSKLCLASLPAKMRYLRRKNLASELEVSFVLRVLRALESLCGAILIGGYLLRRGVFLSRWSSP
jgi:hypothetical protein